MKRTSLFLALTCICCSAVTLSAQETDENESLFKLLDKNGDEVLTTDEIKTEHQQLFKRMLAKGDINGDKKLKLLEFKLSMREDAPATVARFGSRAGAPSMQIDPAAIFKRIDKNQDGKLVKEEFPEDRRENFDRMLAQFDNDSDKALSLQEFKNLNARARGESPSSQKSSPAKKGSEKPSTSSTPQKKSGTSPGQNPIEIVKRIMQMDKNRDGKLSPAEAPERMKQRFSNIDTNKDGFLDSKEIQTVMERALKARPSGSSLQRKKPGQNK